MTTHQKPLHPADLPTLLAINEQGLPGVGKVSLEALTDLLSLCELAVGEFDNSKLVGFVLCLLPQTRYASPNYAWFNERYTDFLYVDRIAVASTQRNKRIGTHLYKTVFSTAETMGLPIAAEVSLQPLNEGSMRFHFRHDFKEVGTLRHPKQTVRMLMRPFP